MNVKLCLQAVGKFLLGVVLLGLLLFLPAGTVSFWNGWLLMGVLFIPMLPVGVVLLLRDPALLASRLEAREQKSEQRLVVRLNGLMFVAGFMVAGLSHRFGWLILPAWLSIAAAVLFLLGYLLYARVLQENRYLARTITVQEGQQVIDTGLYGIVRHPMYAATLLLFLSVPLVLGSLLSFPVFLAYPFIIAKRIRHEEDILEAELEGYREYKSRVRYRLIPFVW